MTRIRCVYQEEAERGGVCMYLRSAQEGITISNSLIKPKPESIHHRSVSGSLKLSGGVTDAASSARAQPGETAGLWSAGAPLLNY